jgi:hypothetical protein
MINSKQKVESERPALPESDTEPMNKFVGIGVGIVTGSYHFEIGLEQLLNPDKGLQEAEEDPEPDARNRISVTIEGKIFGIRLGYTRKTVYGWLPRSRKNSCKSINIRK